MKNFTILLIVLGSLFSCNSSEKHKIISYIETNHISPNNYVVKKFKDHDVIFIGENHFIKQQVEFIKDLIPDLYKNGIYYLGSEFFRYNDTELINKLITNETFDEELAKEILYKSMWHWGYKEYIDIYKKAWELNKSLPKEARTFRIFGMQDVRDYSYVKTQEDMDNPEIMKKVFSGSSQFEEEEGYSAYTIQKEVIDHNEKALIHCGMHHAFTSYYQPNYNPEVKGFGGRYNKERFGNLIKNKIGDKTMTIALHGPWWSKNGYEEKVLPVDGVLDSLFSLKEYEKLLPFGVDTKGTPLGELKGENSVYKHGYSNFTLKDFCDGYIFLMSINNYDAVTAIPDFIKPDQVEYVKSQDLEYRDANITADNLNDSIRIWLENNQEEYRILK